jgi:hypothetical protein
MRRRTPAADEATHGEAEAAQGVERRWKSAQLLMAGETQRRKRKQRRGGGGGGGRRANPPPQGGGVEGSLGGGEEERFRVWFLERGESFSL